MKFALIFSALAVAIRLGAFHYGHPIEGQHFMLLHLLLILGSVYFSIREQYVRGPVEFVSLLRAGMRGAGIYAMLIGLFIWIFYSYVDTEFFPDRIEQLVAGSMDEGQPEEIVRERTELFFTPFNYATITLVGLIMIGALNSILLTLLHTKLLPRLKR